jgi:hypothetical protein
MLFGVRAATSLFLVCGCLLLTPRALNGDKPQVDYKAKSLSILFTALQEMPARWPKLPPPLVLPSGRTEKEVLNAASDQQKRAVLERFLLLLGPMQMQEMLQPDPEERQASFLKTVRMYSIMAARKRSNSSSLGTPDADERSQPQPLTELDVWAPFDLTFRTEEGDQNAALSLHALLLWAETLGRRDAVLRAADAGLLFLSNRLPLSEERARPSLRRIQSFRTARKCPKIKGFGAERW